MKEGGGGDSFLFVFGVEKLWLPAALLTGGRFTTTSTALLLTKGYIWIYQLSSEVLCCDFIPSREKNIPLPSACVKSVTPGTAGSGE